MKFRKEYFILALVIIALSVYLIMRRDDRALYKLPEVPPLSQKEITKLQISQGDTVIVLNKKDDKWYIAPKDYPTDTGKVKNMLDQLEKLTLTALVSESKNYNRYDLIEDTKINVKAWQADKLRRDVDVGKTASSFRHTFVKTAGDDRVFHARGNFRNTFDVKLDDLRDKTVLAFKPAEIQQIELTKNRQSLLLTRTRTDAKQESQTASNEETASAPTPKTSWQTAEGQIGDESALNQLLSVLSNLRCKQFIDDRKKEDFNAPTFSVQLKGAQEFKLSLFAKSEEEDTDYPATSSMSDYPFLLSANQADRFMKAPSEFLKKSETEENKSESPPSESN